MATIGYTSLFNPETGWKRYDDTDSRIVYTGVWTNYPITQETGGSVKYVSGTVTGKTISFKFYGTKLRIIGECYSPSADGDIYIDGIKAYTINYANGDINLYSNLIAEILGLELKVHQVSIIFKDTGYAYFSALDIDSTGYLVHPLLNEVKNINDVKNIGDCIPCKYTSLTSGQIGYFSELGTTTSTLIPTASSSTPNGSFYWVYVGKDYLGRKKFIADRNIQHSISWDVLNIAGICSEININEQFNYIDISKSCNVSASSSYSTCVPNSVIDDILPGAVANGWASGSNSPSEWLKISTTDDISGGIIKFYNSSDSDSNIGIYTASIDVMASEDDVVYTKLTTLTFTGGRQWGSVTIPNDTNYKYFKFTNHVSVYPQSIGFSRIGEIKLLKPKNNDCNYSIKLLTGGISSTDTDNEWDKIIVNSTLGGTITAGDNNVWNWNGISSWTSSTNGGTSTNKILRGKTTVSSYDAAGSGNIDTTYGFRPVMLIEQNIKSSVFSGNLLSSSVHNQDTTLTGSITDSNNPALKSQYKILLNDTQIYPTSGYTDFAISPISINYDIPNSLLTNLNNKITIIVNNEANLVSTYNFYVTVYNNVPNGILSLSNTTTHNTNIELTGNITDTDLDQISYRILINGTEMLSWSTFTTDPYIDYTINANDLIIGSNTIEVDYKDNFKNVGLGSWTNTITRTNNPPIINIQYVNGSIIGTITDIDSDLTQYRILINGTQKYPETIDYTDLKPVNNINYQINRNDILIGKNNIITVFAKDSLNSVIGQEISFIGDYIGLMFMDENQQFYTTDIGELLQYLDFGIITLGQITEPVKILVQNKYGFSIKDINLYVQNSLPNVNIELSKEENPFIATDNLILSNTYKPNEIDYFYVRLNTSISANSVSGEFKIYAKATPLS